MYIYGKYLIFISKTQINKWRLIWNTIFGYEMQNHVRSKKIKLNRIKNNFELC